MTAPDPDNVGEYLISARSYAEYLAMFDLTDELLGGTVLDCPGGGSSFTAEAARHGTQATAADPVYAKPSGELAAFVLAEADRGSAHTGAGADRYVWDFYGDLAGHHRIRSDSARLFATDLVANPDRYVAAALPRLPFADGQFDLVLSSHLLFTYTDRLDAAFHLRALLELRRVGRGEVRVFPLLEQGGRRVDGLLDEVRAGLSDAGIDSAVRRVGYEFQRGGDEMLVLIG